MRGAIAPWAKGQSPYYRQTIEALAKHYEFDKAAKWRDLPERAREVLLYGSEGEKIRFRYDEGGRVYEISRPFEGVIPNMERRYRETDSAWSREEMERYQNNRPCGTCGGFRLKPEALAVKIAGLHVGEVVRMSIREAQAWVETVPASLTAQRNEIARAILKEIRERLGFLVNVGLDYLTLARNAGTLSGGESQRIRLASQIGSGLTGVLYVLDEPSIGLHQRDNGRLLTTLKNLRDAGNTVIVVEHDEEAIREADHVIDIGPGAGVHGGEIIADGHAGRHRGGAGLDHRPVPDRRARRSRSRASGARATAGRLTVRGATGNNLRSVTASFPLGTFTCVTGVSGGGKSTLTIETLFKTASMRLNGARQTPAPCETIEGLEHLDKVIDIDQSPIGRTPRSNPATYTGAFGPIRDWFAGLPESKARGYKPGRFSFNVKGGRCEACQGDGVIKIEMHFLPDVYVTCETCKGKRYNRETLEVLFKGKSIADVLDMTVEDAEAFFAAVPAIREKMTTLMRVGLGYVKVGQQATTLSGGEAQRVKLSKELSRRSTGRTLYILDEPTTGLHFEDTRKLLEVLHELVEQGNTRGRDRAQPRRHQDRRPHHRHRPRGRRRRRHHRRHRHAGGDRAGAGEPHRPLPRGDPRRRGGWRRNRRGRRPPPARSGVADPPARDRQPHAGRRRRRGRQTAPDPHREVGERLRLQHVAVEPHRLDRLDRRVRAARRASASASRCAGRRRRPASASGGSGNHRVRPRRRKPRSARRASPPRPRSRAPPRASRKPWKSCRSSDFGGRRRQVRDARPARPAPPRRPAPPAATAPSSSNARPSRSARKSSISALPGPVSKATSAPSASGPAARGSTQVTLPTPPRFRNATGASAPIDSGRRRSGRTAPAAPPRRREPTSAVRKSQTTGSPTSSRQPVAAPDLVRAAPARLVRQRLAVEADELDPVEAGDRRRRAPPAPAPRPRRARRRPGQSPRLARSSARSSGA